MLHLRSLTGCSIHLQCWNAFRFGQSNKFRRKNKKKKLDMQVWLLSRSSRRRPENVLGMSWINLPGTSLEPQIKTSLDVVPGRPQYVKLARPRDVRSKRSNKIFTGHPGDVGGGRPRDALGNNICHLGSFSSLPSRQRGIGTALVNKGFLYLKLLVFNLNILGSVSVLNLSDHLNTLGE